MSEKYKCEECGKSFDSKRGLHIHIGEVHPDKEEELLEEDESEETAKEENEDELGEPSESPKEETKSHTKIMAIVGVVGIIVIAGLFLVNSNGMNNNLKPKKQIENGTSDTGDVVVTVNGEPIKESSVKAMKQQLAMMRRNVSRKTIVEELVNQEVLAQEAGKEGYNVSEEEVKDKLKSQLTGRNMTIEDLKQQVEKSGGSWKNQIEKYKKQLTTQNYIDEAIAGKINLVTEKDIKDYYEMYKNRTQQKLPPLEQVKQKINKTLQQRERQKAIGSLVQELKSDYDIKYK